MMTQDPYHLIGNYKTIPGVYDELYDAEGQIRNKYKFLVKSFQELGPAELINRRRDTDRILRENGVTYNLYQSDSPEAKERPWDLDLFPLVMESEEWRVLERGLNQRADLLDALVRDVYSKRRLLYEKKFLRKFYLTNLLFCALVMECMIPITSLLKIQLYYFSFVI